MRIYQGQDEHSQPRADMFLPVWLLILGILLAIVSAALIGVGLFFLFIWGADPQSTLLPWFGAAACVILAVFAVLCWRNQKIHMIDNDSFEYITFSGKKHVFLFDDITRIRQNTDSLTIFVGKHKVHVEFIAIFTERLAKRIGTREARLLAAEQGISFTPVAKMHQGQDGAVYGDCLFRFDADGSARVYDATALEHGTGFDFELPLLAEFHLSLNDPVVPHFNAVVFGNEYYEEGDEFPLLYANLYNNYASAEDRREGTCCVYRIVRQGNDFSMTLLQIIRIGFTDDLIWRSEVKDVRPYGNFVIDREKSVLYAFTMRDGDNTTRYFAFNLPRIGDGSADDAYGVPVVTLRKEDILYYFDTDYHLYIQGACCHGGLIFSSEGFNETIPPALRVINPQRRLEIRHVDLVELGLPCEAEWIDFYHDKCYYSDSDGRIYHVKLGV